MHALHGEYLTASARDVADALKVMERRNIDLLFLGRTLQGNTAHALHELRALHPTLPSIVISTSADAPRIVEAMRTGATDFLTHPFQPEEARSLAERAMRRSVLHRNATSLRQQIERTFPVDRMVGDSAAFTASLGDALLASQGQSPVLLVGEHGTGRELMARMIHAAGPCSEEPFVPVHCGALAAAPMHVELFGSASGDGESRHGQFDVVGSGTLYLHEVNQLDRSTQGRLARIIKQGSFHRVRGARPVVTRARVIAASRVAPEDPGPDARFDAAFLGVLGTSVVRVPPLRERRQDIPALARHYLQRFRRSSSCAAQDFSQDAFDILMSYPWPGNIRELRNVIERALVLHPQAPVLRAVHLPSEFHAQKDLPTTALQRHGTLAQAVDAFERVLVERALLEAGGVQTRAAELLGTTRRVLKYRMEKLNISVP
jgi:DNA-binding NtrC family response regulator